MQQINRQVDLMRLQGSAHRPARVHSSSRLQDGRQLFPPGQEEGHRRVDWNHGPAEPEGLKTSRSENQRGFEQKQEERDEKSKISCLTCPRTLGNDVLIDTWTRQRKQDDS